MKEQQTGLNISVHERAIVNAERNDATFFVDFGTGFNISLTAIKRCAAAGTTGSEHLWVIQAAHILDDPGLPKEQIRLSRENFIGVSDVLCLLCWERYDGTNRHGQCPQRTPKLNETFQ